MTDEPVPTHSAEDTRRPAYGLGRVLILVYGIFALAASARAAVQLLTRASEAPLAYSLSAAAAVVYVLATIALAHNGRRMRRVGWTAVGFELAGVITVGTLSLVVPELFPDATVWSRYGSGYGYVPAVLPVLGLAWLWHSAPARIAARGER
ncbi:membrane protein [Georgenia halophila]|uniref:Membrane protein n=1 Tax=Georgenia halophila TaxID=620889 RepID=A0ABP8LQV0_9MICO